MPYSCVQRDHQATQHSMYKAGTLFKPPGCMCIGLELLAAQAEVGRNTDVRAGQAAVGLDKHVC